MSGFLGVVVAILIIVAIPILLIGLIVKAIMKKPLKNILISLCICGGAIIPLTIIGVLTDPATRCDHNDIIVEEISPACTEKGSTVYVCDKCERKKTVKIDKLEHDMKPIENGSRCTVCGYEEIIKLETSKDEMVETAEIEQTPIVEDVVKESPVETKKDEPIVEKKTYIEGIGFDEIYRAYKENELRADDTYQYNRYRITAKVNGMDNDGLLNLTGGAVLTMQKKVGNTIVFFHAEFDRHQEEDLKLINVGDTITFEGKCLDASSWTDCSIVTN